MVWHPQGNFVAWATATSVTVIEMETKQVISQIGRPAAATGDQQCQLSWAVHKRSEGAVGEIANSAASPSTFIRCFNSDKKGGAREMTVSPTARSESLLVGWGRRVLIMSIRHRTADQTSAGLPPYFLSEQSAFELTNGMICGGIAPYDERLLAVLCLPTAALPAGGPIAETEDGQPPDEYVTISRAQARSGFEMDSAPTNAVEKHARLRVLESRTNAAG